jgi:peptide/nickel transport system permease protein
VHGDFGESIASHRPVIEDLREYAPATIELASVSFLLSLLIGLPLGVLAAVRRDSWIDNLARVDLAGRGLRPHLLARLRHARGLLRRARHRPGPGRLDALRLPTRPPSAGLLLLDTAMAGDWETFRDAAAHLVLPSDRAGQVHPRPHHAHDPRGDAGIASPGTMSGTARAKGLPRRGVVMGHAWPNALLPVVTLGGLAYANLLAGAVMTETVFSWPGLGRYTFRSAVAIDFPAILAITVIVAALFVAVNFLVDMSYALLDPRTVKK